MQLKLKPRQKSTSNFLIYSFSSNELENSKIETALFPGIEKVKGPYELALLDIPWEYPKFHTS